MTEDEITEPLAAILVNARRWALMTPRSGAAKERDWMLQERRARTPAFTKMLNGGHALEAGATAQGLSQTRLASILQEQGITSPVARGDRRFVPATMGANTAKKIERYAERLGVRPSRSSTC